MLVGDEMRYLGLDLGTKTLGVAITDETKTIATLLKVIHFPSEQYEVALEELSLILIYYSISKISL